MIKTVAIHEFLFTIKRKAFYLVTLGMPLIVLAYAGFVGLITYVSAAGELKELVKPLGVVDDCGLLTATGGTLHGVAAGEVYEYQYAPAEISDPLKRQLDSLDIPLTRHKIRRYEALAEAHQDLLAGKLRGVVLIPQDYMHSGEVRHYMKQRSLLKSADGLGFLRGMLVESILRQANLAEDAVQRVRQRPDVAQYELGPQRDFVAVDMWSKGFSVGIPLGTGMLLIIALMMNGSLLVASVAEEKENKVMEVILSSVPAEQLLFGKVLGLVGAGLLQIAVWMAMIGAVPLLTMSAVQHEFDYDVKVLHLVLGAFFVILGFVFYGCLLAGFGSLGATYKDCQQLTVAIILCAAVPMMTFMTYMNDPDGIVGRVLSLIPLFSPGAMMLRLGLADVPWWEVALSLVLLILSIWGAVKISARLFRVGTLMYGKRPGLREIVQALRG